MRPDDPRTTPWRPDLAAEHLRASMPAERYAKGEPRSVSVSVAPVRSAPDDNAERVTEALFGEAVTIYEIAGNWAWGQLAADGYVGYLRAQDVAGAPHEPTHQVRALRTFRFLEPDFKAPVLGWASLCSPVAVLASEGRFSQSTDASWIFSGDLAPRRVLEADFVAVAERFLATPYLWGGRTSFGLDCSALLQLSLSAAGIACPRDSDMIEAQVGHRLERETIASGHARRGDLVFWRGHCAIMASAVDLLHANAHHMATVKEPADAALARIAEEAGPVTALKRLA